MRLNVFLLVVFGIQLFSCTAVDAKFYRSRIFDLLPANFVNRSNALMVCTMIGGGEAPYLAEWIAYHTVIGVTKFVLFEMNSNEVIREVLRPYISSGLVALLPEAAFVPPDFAESTPDMKYSTKSRLHEHAVGQCQRIAKRHARWLVVMDPDEYIVGQQPEQFPRWLARLEATNNVGAVALFRTDFGTNGHKTHPEGLLALEAYTSESGAETTFPKLVTFSDAVRRRGNHDTTFKSPSFRCLSTDGQSLASCSAPGTRVERSTTGFYLAHFMSRSLQECLDKNSGSFVSKWRVDSSKSATKSFPEAFCERFLPSHDKQRSRTTVLQLITPQLAQLVREEIISPSMLRKTF